MAATAWSLYNTAKKYIMDGTIDLDTASLKMKLYTSASNASTFTLSTMSQVTNQATGGGYSEGKALTTVSVTSIVSAKSYSLDCADVVFTASNSSLVNVKFAVIGISGGKAICWSKLSTSQFTVTSPNTLTVVIHANGIFALA